MGSTHTLLFLGKPGAGKSAQAKRLLKGLSWRYCSSGDYFRNLERQKSDLGDRVRTVYQTGAFLPSFFVTKAFVDAVMRLSPQTRIIFDGFGRSERQANEAHEVLTWFGRSYVAINLEVSDETIVRRITERNKTENRIDSDTEDKIRKRLADYHLFSNPALAVFESHGVLRRINGERPVEAVHLDVIAAL